MPIINGSNAADSLAGSAGQDTINGFGGADRLFGGTGNNLLYGGDGNDELKTEYRNDMLYGGAGNDILAAGNGSDSCYGGSGSDTLWAGRGDDRLDGGDGTDSARFLGASAGYTVTTSNGITVVTDNVAGDGNDGIDRLSGIEQLIFTDRVVTIGGGGSGGTTPTAGDDDLVLGGDADSLSALAGDDTVYGGDGNDHIAGGLGSDTLYGGAGSDRLNEIDDPDATGGDTVVGGAGKDVLGGTRGADRFVFDDGDSGNNHTTRDMIVRLSAADGDLVDLSAIDANTGAGGDQAFTWIGRADFTAAGQVRWYTYRSDGMLHEVIELNTGGASGPEMQIKIVDTLIPTPDLFIL